MEFCWFSWNIWDENKEKTHQFTSRDDEWMAPLNWYTIKIIAKLMLHDRQIYFTFILLNVSWNISKKKKEKNAKNHLNNLSIFRFAWVTKSSTSLQLNAHKNQTKNFESKSIRTKSQSNWSRKPQKVNEENRFLIWLCGGKHAEMEK